MPILQIFTYWSLTDCPFKILIRPLKRKVVFLQWIWCQSLYSLYFESYYIICLNSLCEWVASIWQEAILGANVVCISRSEHLLVNQKWSTQMLECCLSAFSYLSPTDQVCVQKCAKMLIERPAFPWMLSRGLRVGLCRTCCHL